MTTSPVLTERFERAFIFATRLHSRQLRKASDVPFIAHLLSVTASVLEDGGTEDEAIAALLHDAVEDQGGQVVRQQILGEFGPNVAAIVDGCSDTDQDPKPPWLQRKQLFLHALEVASPSVLRVMAADKLENVRSLIRELERHGSEAWSYFRGGREGTLWYYQSASSLLRRRLPDSSLVSELDRQVAFLGKW